MTLEETTLISEVLGCVDGGCSQCAGDAMEHASRLMPGLPWLEAVRALPVREWDESLADGGGGYTRGVSEDAKESMLRRLSTPSK